MRVLSDARMCEWQSAHGAGAAGTGRREETRHGRGVGGIDYRDLLRASEHACHGALNKTRPILRVLRELRPLQVVAMTSGRKDGLHARIIRCVEGKLGDGLEACRQGERAKRSALVDKAQELVAVILVISLDGFFCCTDRRGCQDHVRRADGWRRLGPSRD